jgi:hypothetical protein
MARQMATITFITLLALTSIAGMLDAQGRGRGNHSGPVGRMGSPPVAARAGRMGPPVGAGPVGRPAIQGSAFVRRLPPVVAPPIGVGPAIVGRAVRPQHRVRLGYGPYFGYGAPYYPYSAPYLGYGSTIYPYPQVYAEPAYTAPAPETQTQSDLTYEVQRLSREIEQLREEQVEAIRQAQTPPPPPEPERPAIPTTLVFRDGRRLSIVNYAIVGQTLWVLDEQNSTRIAVSDLDIDTTVRENRAQGVRFPLPR